MSSYPLGQSEADTITSRTGKKLSQITLDEVKKGNVTADDIKICLLYTSDAADE